MGQTKNEAYHAARTLYTDGDISGIDTKLDRETEIRLHPYINRHHPVADTRQWFDRWNHWSLSHDGDDPQLILILRFEGENLSTLGYPSEWVDSWHPPEADEPMFALGQSYEEVFRALLQLSKMPDYRDLVIASGWMARRQPIAFAPEEYRLIRSFDEWILFVGDHRSYFDTIELSFNNDKLGTIHRSRHIEAP